MIPKAFTKTQYIKAEATMDNRSQKYYQSYQYCVSRENIQLKIHQKYLPSQYRLAATLSPGENSPKY